MNSKRVSERERERFLICIHLAFLNDHAAMNQLMKSGRKVDKKNYYVNLKENFFVCVSLDFFWFCEFQWN
jgi:hypothetical protein